MANIQMQKTGARILRRMRKLLPASDLERSKDQETIRSR